MIKTEHFPAPLQSPISARECRGDDRDFIPAGTFHTA